MVDGDVLGITGGVEDRVHNSAVRKEKLRGCLQLLLELLPVSEKVTIAAAFSNVHGVYKAGNVKLQPELLGTFQKYAARRLVEKIRSLTG